MNICRKIESIFFFLVTLIFTFTWSLYSADYSKYDPKTEQSFNKNTIKEDVSKFNNVIDATTYLHTHCLDNRFKAAIYTAEQIKIKFNDKTYDYYTYWSLLGWSYMMTGEVDKAIDAYKVHFKVINYPYGIPKDKENTDDYKMREWIHVINKFKENLHHRKWLLEDIYKYSLEFNKKFPNAPEEYSKIPNGIIRIYEEMQNEKSDYEINKALVEDFFQKLALIIKNKDKVKLKEFLDANSINNETSSAYYNYFTEYFFEWEINSLEFKITDFDYSRTKYNKFEHSTAFYKIESIPDIDSKIRNKMNDYKVEWALSFKFNNNRALLYF